MVTILVAAGEDEKDFYNELKGLLSEHFADNAIKLCDFVGFKEAGEKDKVIVVYKQQAPIPEPLAVAQSSVVAIVDSGSEELLCHVSDTRLPAITCGLRSRDTITLSSMDGESAVVDLRRCICCLDGSEAEPQEIPLKRPATQDNFLLMAFAAILILTGKAESLKDGII